VFSLSWVLCLFIPGVSVRIPSDTYLLTFWSAGYLPHRFGAASGDAGALIFSQCYVVWRSLVWSEGSGFRSFDSSWWYFPAKCGSRITIKFLILGAHAVCFCTLVSILYPPSKSYIWLGLVSRIYRELLKLNNKKWTNKFKTLQRN
jgi:hypothetical protein